MVRTTSLKHYKELKAKGINVELVTKQDLINKMDSKRLDLEASIMVALFKATISQSQFLIDELKHNRKKTFYYFISKVKI